MNPLRALLCIVALLGLCILSQPVAASEDMPREAQEALYRAQQALKKDRYDQARSRIRKYLGRDPENPPAQIFLFLGNSWYDQNRMDKAREAYGKGLRAAPDNESLTLNYAVACYRTEHFSEAGRYFAESFELQQSGQEEADPSLLFKSGSAYYNAKEFAKAEESLTRLLDVAKRVKTEWLKLFIHTELNLKKWARAEEAINRLLERNPSEEKYWQLLAQMHMNANHYSEAASALEIAYRLEEPEPKKWEDLADLYLYIDAPLKAVECLNKAYGDNLTPERCDKIARAYAQALRYGDAARYVRRAIEQKATAKRYMTRGTYLYRDRKYEKAVDSFQAALEMTPDNGRAHLFLGFCAMELRDWDMAKESFAAAAEFEDYRSWARGSLAMVKDILQARKSASEADSASG